ncbi:23S rRNA (adenine(2503)-C(2))-methyltransferase RlmN [Candidatus Avoscillospira sp. LCP25S3_F1]|uniref:23S rRNA (adenine(2503)-C(2))-methyltransferase RlmN n=1 Tax=Candidatus Avoscillospira sp. LCP25S3_F1 TaxID=3438825 RepID=UPI003F8EA6D7
MKQDIKSMTLAEMTQALKAMGQPAFRAKQIYTWLHKGVTDFEEMTNISKELRAKLDETYYITAPKVARKQQSQKDGTVKYLWELGDGNCVETVLMQYHHGNTVCISSEVGCPMGCKFCASTLGGLVRRLQPSEILDQVLFTALDSGLPISNIVLMGIGEPLDNFDNVMRFLELVNSPEGMNIGMRHISLSTCGLVPRIDELAEKKLQLTLSVSLHSPDDASRSAIMPINRKYPVDVLLDACRRYFEKTGRRVSFEYTMIDGVSDSPEQAELLASKLHGLAAHVNMIPLNPVAESPLRPSSRQAVARFQKILEGHGIPATVRRSLGGDIDASCGQLRRKYVKESEQTEGTAWTHGD